MSTVQRGLIIKPEIAVRPKKTGDLYQDAKNGYYNFNAIDNHWNKQGYRDQQAKNTAEFMEDLIMMLIENNVPEKYATKSAVYAWEQGHSNGYFEVVLVADDLLQIFQIK